MKNFIVIAILALTTLLLADFPGFNFYSAWQKPVPEGELNGSSIGRGMAIIKDINHDGYDELAVAAELACDTATAEIRGKVYIYMGGQGAPLTLPEQPTVVLRGEKHRDWYGFDISSGDFNGDGNTDVAILAQGNNDNSHIYNYGRAYLYLGTDPPSLAPGEFMDTVPDLIYTPPNATGFLYQLPFVGDINDDGYDDIAIPLRCFSLGIKKTLLFYGDSLPDLIADDSIIVDDTPFYDIAVGCGGDINGDGIADLMIGSRCAGNDTGKVFIFPGGNPFVTEPSNTLVGSFDHQWFGWYVTVLGDINSDGFDDIGVIGGTSSSWARRSCFIYWGSDSGVYEFAGLVADSIRQLYGTAMVGAGDINFDGYDDFIIGAPGANVIDFESGHVHVYYGGPDVPETSSVFMVGEVGNDQYGVRIAAGGDINGDGYFDFAIGANKSHAGGYYAGRVYVHSGKMMRMNNFDPQVIMDGQPARGWAGYILASGDINGDGFNDIAFTYEHNYLSSVYLCLGAPGGLDFEPAYILSDSTPFSWFGNSIDFGDFDGDGIEDLAIGIPYWSTTDDYPYNINEGEVRIYFGSANFLPTPGLIIHGPAYQKKLVGWSVAFIGDITGNGAEELLIGAPEYKRVTGHRDSTGYAYLYYGGTSGEGYGDTLPDAVYKGNEGRGGFGSVVIGPGDMTGDGIPDFVISAPGNHSTDSTSGIVYFYEGHPTIPPTTPLVIYTDSIHNGFGEKLAAPGDLNGDGYDDLLITSRFTDLGGASGGYGYGNAAVCVYLGGNPLSATPYWEITAPIDCEGGFGIGLGELGDINLDDFPDFAIGAPNGIPNEWMMGAPGIVIVGHNGNEKVYIYYGSGLLNCDHDAVLTPPKGREMFGYDICAAGMTSWDGSNDIVIGAPGNSMAGYESGKVYLLSSIYSAITEKSSKPEELALHAYPNPFNSNVVIEITGAQSNMPLQLEIFDINGRKIAGWDMSYHIPANRYIWNGKDDSSNELPSGVYFARLSSNSHSNSSGKVISHKIVLIK